jgi:hypothetical protein
MNSNDCDAKAIECDARAGDATDRAKVGESPCEQVLIDIRNSQFQSKAPFNISSAPNTGACFEWHVVRIKPSPTVLIGYVKAADAYEAIKLAAAERGISDPTTLSRLAAQKVREIF